MDVRVLTPNSRYGSHLDIVVVVALLQRLGYSVGIAHLDEATEPADCNLFLGSFARPSQYNRHVRHARCNILIPNAEMLDKQWLPRLNRLDALFVKTREAERLFKRCASLPVHFTSFTTPDRYVPTTTRLNELTHLAGWSPFKNTPLIVEAYEKAGERLPPMHLHFHPRLVADKFVDLYSVPNLRKVPLMLEPSATTELINRYRLHLIPSTYEGFGHYYNEVKSAQGIVITTDAAPMNELIDPSFGFLIPARAGKVHGMARLSHCSSAAVIKVIEKKIVPLIKDPAQMEAMGHLARLSYLQNDQLFCELFASTLRRVMKS